jgi:hypothetical protein
MNVLRIVAIALGLLIPIIINVGLEVVQPSPAYWRSKDTHEHEILKQAYVKHADIVFYTSVGITITLIIVGALLVLTAPFKFVGEGFLIGAVITMMIAFAKYWSRMNYWSMLLASTAAFIMLIVIGMMFNRSKKQAVEKIKTDQKKEGL